MYKLVPAVAAGFEIIAAGTGAGAALGLADPPPKRGSSSPSSNRELAATALVAVGTAAAGLEDEVGLDDEENKPPTSSSSNNPNPPDLAAGFEETVVDEPVLLFVDGPSPNKDSTIYIHTQYKSSNIFVSSEVKVH